MLLLWPALLNGYPLLFSDTGAFLTQLLQPLVPWDKPWIYGPALAVASLRLSLWLPAAAQALCVSWVLWRVQSVFRMTSPAWHVALCALLAAATPVAWFASLLMPDVLAPLTVLTLFLLAFDPRQHGRWAATALASFAIAAHLAHLVVAAACLLAIGLLRPRALPRAALPFGVAVGLLLATNLATHRALGISPHGAVFGLARLAADGPAATYLEAVCPDAGYRICAWAGRLPTDVNIFLWDPDGPVWTYPGGPIGLAPEASRIIVATILAQPGQVAHAALGNTLAQLRLVLPDQVLDRDWLDIAVLSQIEAHYPAAEQARYRASLQRTGELHVLAQPLLAWQPPLLALAALGCVGLLPWAWRHDRHLLALIMVILAGVLGNAFGTGALAGPHDRYQARIAWIVLLPPLLWLLLRVRQLGQDAVGHRVGGLGHRG